MSTARVRDKGDLIMPDVDHGTKADTDTARARDRAESGRFPDTSAPPPHDETDADLRDLPRNEKPRHGAIGGPAPDPRAGETGTQDVAPTEEDIRLEATLQGHRAGDPTVHEWMAAQRRVEPGLESAVEDARSGNEDLAVRGPERGTGKGRVVTDGETVADDDADADATRDRTAGRNTDDAGAKG
jgi:hypothetical protein